MDEFAFSGSTGGFGSRVWKRAMVLGAVLALVSSGFALADDAKADGDTAVSSSNPNVTDCSTEHVFTGSLKIDFGGGPTTHFASGATLTLSVAPDAAATAASITASGPSNATLPSPWESGGSHTVSGYTTTVPAGIASGTYKITYGVSGPRSTSGTLTIDDFFNVNVECADAPTNTAPTVSADTDPVTVDEGDTASNTGSYEDADDDEVTLTASVGTVTDNEDGTWSWDFTTTDGPAESQTVTITADDGTDTGSVDFGLTVDNVPPTVGSLTPSTADVLVGQNVTFTGSATDPSGPDTAAGFDWAFDTGAGFGSYSASNQVTTSFSTCGSHMISAKARDKDFGESQPAESSAVGVYEAHFKAPLTEGMFNLVQKGRVVPVKIDVGCGGLFNGGLAPQIQLLSGEVDPGTDPGDASNVTTTTVSAADTTGVMRQVDGQYIYNLLVPNGAQGQKYTIRVRPFGVSGGGIYVVIQIRK